MAESTLSMNFDDLAAEIGRFLGYGGTAGNWSADELAQIDSYIQAGLRRFYVPPRLPRENTPHEWSFLKPVETVVLYVDIAVTSGITVTGVKDNGTTTVTASEAAFYPTMIGRSIVITGVGTFTITAYTSSTVIVVSGDASAAAADTFSITAGGLFRLPDDFGGVLGPITFGSEEALNKVYIGAESDVRVQRQRTSRTGDPEIIAVRPVENDGTTGQRFDFSVWPDPDTDYNASFRMQVLMDKLTTTKYPYGGMLHAETILEFCLWVAEERANDVVDGPHSKAALLRLEASVALDRRTGPEHYGYCGDPTTTSDWVSAKRLRHTTYNGVEY